MKNPVRPEIPNNTDNHFFTVNDGSRIFIYDYKPGEKYEATIFIISGITGINHLNETDIIEQLSNNKNRVVVIHPRGSGYSDGKRGDISDFSLFIDDYIEVISKDEDYKFNNHPIILFGHSMSCAILQAIAQKVENISGAILVNPTYILKESKGMSPSIKDYIEYALYFIFSKHKPIVNMAGAPNLIENEEDRKESESRINDPLLTKYFSLYMMMEARKVMNSMLSYSKKANYPLLLLYGMNDNIVDKKGCDIIYNEWYCENKQYHQITNGSHGKSTVKLADEIIKKWIDMILETSEQKSSE